MSLVDDKAAAETHRASRHCAKGLLSGLSRHRVRTNAQRSGTLAGLEELIEAISPHVPQIGHNKLIY